MFPGMKGTGTPVNPIGSVAEGAGAERTVAKPQQSDSTTPGLSIRIRFVRCNNGAEPRIANLKPYDKAFLPPGPSNIRNRNGTKLLCRNLPRVF